MSLSTASLLLSIEEFRCPPSASIITSARCHHHIVLSSKLDRMYPSGQHPIFPYSMQERQEILEETGFNEIQLQADVDTVLDWYQNQPHLPEDIVHRNLVEIILIAAKGSVEKVKRRIDNFYKYRGLAPEFIHDRIELLKDPNFTLWSSFLQTPLPKLYNGKRISILLFTDPDSSTINTQDVFLSILMMVDIRAVHDFMLGDIWILDLKHCTIGHAMKMNPMMLHKAVKIFRDGVVLKVFGFHVINCRMANVMQFALNFFKQLLSEKVFGRIKFHDTLESLYEEVPKEYLPKDYGGDLQSIADISNNIGKVIRSQETREYLIEACKQTSDESKRPRDAYDEECMHGTFKKLDLD